jgi:hypothetical protein
MKLLIVPPRIARGSANGFSSVLPREVFRQVVWRGEGEELRLALVKVVEDLLFLRRQRGGSGYFGNGRFHIGDDCFILRAGTAGKNQKNAREGRGKGGEDGSARLHTVDVYILPYPTP